MLPPCDPKGNMNPGSGPVSVPLGDQKFDDFLWLKEPLMSWPLLNRFEPPS